MEIPKEVSERHKLIRKLFYAKFTNQFEECAGDDEKLHFYHTIMEYNATASLNEKGELVVEMH